jgi:diacylglycerol O-acyltransferase-1
LYLNINAELMRFGDRLFYRDWWCVFVSSLVCVCAVLTRRGRNASTTDYFWRNWNIPTCVPLALSRNPSLTPACCRYHWLLKYVYVPMVNARYPKLLAGLVVFTVSAVFHELLIAVPFHSIKGLGFMSMFLQVRLQRVRARCGGV